MIATAVMAFLFVASLIVALASTFAWAVASASDTIFWHPDGKRVYFATGGVMLLSWLWFGAVGAVILGVAVWHFG